MIESAFFISSMFKKNFRKKSNKPLTHTSILLIIMFVM